MREERREDDDLDHGLRDSCSEDSGEHARLSLGDLVSGWVNNLWLEMRIGHWDRYLGDLAFGWING